MADRSTPGEGKRRAVNTKIADSLREKLEAAADASNRTLSHEIEVRLERSLLSDDLTRAIRETIRQEMRAEFEARKPDAEVMAWAANKKAHDDALAAHMERESVKFLEAQQQFFGRPSSASN